MMLQIQDFLLSQNEKKRKLTKHLLACLFVPVIGQHAILKMMKSLKKKTKISLGTFVQAQITIARIALFFCV